MSTQKKYQDWYAIHYMGLETRIEPFSLNDWLKDTVVSLILQRWGQIFIYYKSAERNPSRKEEFVSRTVLHEHQKSFFFLLTQRT